jgi:signal transduction histidine kinase
VTDAARELAARVRAAADAERRQIERDLHDGIQQDLVALAVNLQLARTLADSDPAAAKALLDEMRDDVHEALDGIRRLAVDVYPPTLPTHGLAGAMRTITSAADVRGVRRYPLEVEETVYFCCRELLRDEGATVRVWEEGGALCFSITSRVVDDEQLVRARDRLLAVGGRLDASAGEIRGTIPL